MEVYVKLFATLRKYGPTGLGIGENFPLQLNDFATVRMILTELNIPKDEAKIIMVNGNTVNNLDSPLKLGDEVAIFPPVGGGALQI